MKNPIRNNLIIELHVPDFDAIKDFYSKLGFKITMEDMPNEKNLGYMTMTRKDELGSTMINFYGGDDRVYNQSYFKQFYRETKRGYATEVTITTANIEDAYQKASNLPEGTIVRELMGLEDHGKKWRDFRIVDPFGFYIRFTDLIDWGQE